MKPITIDKQDLKGYSVAPYNFVSLPPKAVVRYNHPNDLPAHNNFKSRDGRKLLSGTICYTLEAKTPIIVSAGEKDKNAYFFINSSGEYAIPGNTIRGFIRANTQILSFSNIIRGNNYEMSEIEDSKFLFRDIAGSNSLSKRYSQILSIDPNKRISRNLRTGYIFNENNKYFIKESEKLDEIRNYFRVDEIYLRKILDEKIIKDIKFMYLPKIIKFEDRIKNLNKIIYGRGSKNKQEIYKAHDEKKCILKDCKNGSYKPYNIEVSYSLDSKSARIIKIGSIGKYNEEGYLLSGGFIDGKMSHYIVPAPSIYSNIIEISQDNIRQYKDDLILTKKMSKSDEKIKSGDEFFNLPSIGNKKPIFFINTDRLHFGFTPYIRMFYSKSVLDEVNPSYKDVAGISYCDSIFGFSSTVLKKDNKEEIYSYKSRVSFEDVLVHEGAIVDKDTSMKIILAEPKSTSYNLYLKQEIGAGKKELNIYEGDFKIRGTKQYWLKDYIERPNIDKQNDNMIFTIHPLKEGTKFSGKIYFNNLEEDELGLLIWALKLEDNCYQSIGLAKPYGFGRVKVSDILLKLENLEKKYLEFSFDFMEDAEIDKYINIYKETFSNKYLNGKSIDEQKFIKEFIYIKSKVVNKKDANWYRYMNLNEFKDKKVLPSILEYADIINKDRMGLDKSRKTQYDKQNNKQNNKQKRNKSKDNYKNNKSFGNSIDLSNWYKGQ